MSTDSHKSHPMNEYRQPIHHVVPANFAGTGLLLRERGAYMYLLLRGNQDQSPHWCTELLELRKIAMHELRI